MGLRDKSINGIWLWKMDGIKSRFFNKMAEQSFEKRFGNQVIRVTCAGKGDIKRKAPLTFETLYTVICSLFHF